MIRRIFPIIAFFLAGSIAQAQVHGVDVEVNEGKLVPTVAQLQTLINPNDIVRDVLGWHLVDLKCNLSANPSATIAIPTQMSMLYANVQAAGARNFVTLAFNNTHCGQLSNSGGKTFPDTNALRAEFAAYAAAVVRQVPALAGVSLWNEMNGTFTGGYATTAERLTNYCLLANQVIGAIRAVDSKIPIAIGATVGAGIDTWFIGMFDTYGCMGKGDPTIWLDVHPYLSGMVVKAIRKTDFNEWNDSIANIRGDNISNPLIATEWGSSAAFRFLQANPNDNYITTFETKVSAHDKAWAALSWFPWKDDLKAPNSGLLDRSGTILTTFGLEYTAAFKQ